MGWTDDLQGCVVQDNGTTVAQRQTLNFHGFDIADDQANGRVDIYATSGSDWKGSVRLCPAAALPAYTRTLSSIEANANAALPSLDGVAAASGDLVLLVGVATASDVDNGIWRITSLGAAGSKWSMARAQEADESVEITPQMVVRVEEGTANKNREFVCTNTGTITINTTPIVFEDLNGATGCWTRTGTTVALTTAGDIVVVDGNFATHAVPSNWRSGARVGWIGQADVIPTAGDPDGSFLFVDPANGNLVAIGENGTETTIALK